MTEKIEGTDVGAMLGKAQQAAQEKRQKFIEEFEAASSRGRIHMEALHEDEIRQQAKTIEELQATQGPGDALGVVSL